MSVMGIYRKISMLGVLLVLFVPACLKDMTWTKVGEGVLIEAKYTQEGFRREAYWELRLDSGDLTCIKEGWERVPYVWTIGSRYVIEKSAEGLVRARKVK